MPVTPSDFLRALVLAITERLQRGDATSLPGVGTWTPTTDAGTGRVSIRFSESDSGDETVDQTLANEVSAGTGAPPSEIAPRIDSFSRAVRAHLAETGSVLLPGIGRLTGKKGSIRFRPELFFAEAVDWDNPLVPVSAQADDEPEMSVSRDASGDFDMDEVEQVAPDEPGDIAAESTEGEARGFAPLDVYEPGSGEEEAAPESGEEATPEPDHRPGTPVEARTPSPPRAVRSPSVRRGRRGMAIPLAIAGFVVIVAAVAVLLTRGGEPGPPSVATTPDTTSAGLTAAAPADSALVIDTTSVAAAEPVPEAPPETVREPAPREAAPREAAAPPATGDFDTAADGYTLVVGSTVVESDAFEEIDAYRQLGLPVAVLAYTDPDGSVRYRLAVGRYESAATADQARQTMAERLPAGTWVRRIRP